MRHARTLPRPETLRRRATQPLLSSLDRLLPGPRRILAVSGGPDSRALMESWARHSHRGEHDVVICVDHGVRTTSTNEAQLVVGRARALGFNAHRVPIFRRKNASVDEATLRDLRFSALAKAAKELGANEVVFAHHRDDDVEGALLHLLGQGGAKEGAALPLFAPLLLGESPDEHDVIAQNHPREKKNSCSQDSSSHDKIQAVRPFRQLYKADLQAALTAWGIHDAFIDGDDAAGRNARARVRFFLKHAAPAFPTLQSRLYQQSVQARERVLEHEYVAAAQELEMSSSDKQQDKEPNDVENSRFMRAKKVLLAGVQGSRTSTRHLLEDCGRVCWQDPRDAKPTVDAMMQALLEEKPHPQHFKMGLMHFVIQRDKVRILPEETA
ncbi:MAG: hypothetical protein GY822_27190 [Deltaproteobacteria bacterium]|nr:hypothetical protein [Deltaproteobacteria bacterium]